MEYVNRRIYHKRLFLLSYFPALLMLPPPALLMLPPPALLMLPPPALLMLPPPALLMLPPCAAAKLVAAIIYTASTVASNPIPMTAKFRLLFIETCLNAFYINILYNLCIVGNQNIMFQVYMSKL